MAFNIEREIRSINEKLSAINVFLRQQEPKKTWVSASVISDLTGWDKNYLKKARRYDMVEAKKTGRFYEYCIESINPVYLKTS